MTESTWQILKFDWKIPGKLDFFFFQKSGNPVLCTSGFMDDVGSFLTIGSVAA